MKYIFFRFNNNQENFVFKLKSNKHPMSVLHEYCQKGQSQYLPTFPIQSLFVSRLGCWVQFYSVQLEFCDKVNKLNGTFFYCTNELKTQPSYFFSQTEDATIEFKCLYADTVTNAKYFLFYLRSNKRKIFYFSRIASSYLQVRPLRYEPDWCWAEVPQSTFLRILQRLQVIVYHGSVVVKWDPRS